MYFPWTVVDYPLAQAVEDRIVKAPIIVDQSAVNQPSEDPDGVTRENVAEKYGYWLDRPPLSAGNSIGRCTRNWTSGRCSSSWRRRMSYADALGRILVEHEGDWVSARSEVLDHPHRQHG